MAVRITTSIAGSLLVALSTSCNAPQDSSGSPPDRRPAVQFSADEKAAARSLSIGNTATLADTTDPYQIAIVCSVAIDSLASTLRQSASLSTAQLSAIEHVSRVYASRVQALAAAKGMGRVESEQDIAKFRDADEEPGERARTAIGCIQRLQ